jgi:hypothetical protein
VAVRSRILEQCVAVLVAGIGAGRM